ncbi:MAG: hypothetical protein KBA53_01665 [Thermoclostridium sp.]|nr:hypothetical protein [Thermoclostridium sp.]
MDSKRNLLLIPLWRENGGPGRFSNKFVKLESGYSYEELGTYINNLLSISRENVPEDKNQKVFELATGIKSWSAFAKKYQLVSVVLTEEYYRVSKQPRKKDNSFGLDKDEVDKYTLMLPINTQVSELGRKVLEAFDLK